MSTYIERYCPTHLEWDDDTDNPAEACPECIKEGLFIPRAKLQAELSTLRAERDRMAAALLVLSNYDTRRDAGLSVRMTARNGLLGVAPRGQEGEG